MLKYACAGVAFVLAGLLAATPTGWAQGGGTTYEVAQSKVELLKQTMGLHKKKDSTQRRSQAPAAASPPPPAADPESEHLDIWVYFEFDSDVLTPAGRAELDALGAALADPQFKGDRWAIEGHTDAQGTETYNMNLSERRALSVYQYLVNQHGADPRSLVPQGKGESQLYDQRRPNAGVNRRVRVKHVGGQG